MAIKAYKQRKAGIYTCHKLLIMLDTECKVVWVVQCPLQQMDKYDNLNDKIFFFFIIVKFHYFMDLSDLCSTFTLSMISTD